MNQPAPAFLVLKNISDREWSFPIDTNRRIVGRSRSADVRVPSRFESVSRRHAEVWADRYGVWIHDLGSSSGTNVNGVWVDHVPQAGLVVGDTIWLGGVEIEVVGEIDELAQFASVPADPGSTMMYRKIAMARRLAHRLSPAEIDVMLWLSRGYEKDAEIGKLLHRSPHTVRTEIGNIFRKLELHSRAELMGWLKRANRAATDELLARARRAARG
jgi:DNA-binding CsgD family transcriptional regulator